MIQITPRDRLIILALLFQVPILWEWALRVLWPRTEAGYENLLRRLHQLCAEGLLERHVAYAQAAESVELFYHWSPGMPEPDYGAHAWELSKRWERLEPRRVVFYTASERAAKHYGRSIRNPLKSTGSIAHNIGLGQVWLEYPPELARAWVAEDVIALTRGHGQKVVDAVVVNSTSTPALAVEFAGSSYAASSGERLREIGRDCMSRQLPYEVWTVSKGDAR